MSDANDVHESLVKQGGEAPEPRRVPPIETIVIPDCATKSAKIRWLKAMGYSVKEVANHLGIRYQMVRNIWTSEPKRAAREDLPPLEFVYREEVDDIQAIMDMALEDSLKAERKQRKAEQRANKSDEGGEDE